MSRCKSSPAVLFVASLALLTAASGLFAGPLTPPSGPVASSNKTLLEVEPRTPIDTTTCPGDATSIFKITRAGSYYLTSGITVGASGKSTIVVAASNVTIDLNGFTLSGTTLFGNPSIHGIALGGSFDHVKVCNGTVRQFGQHGISLGVSGYNARDMVVESVHAEGNGASGILVSKSGVIRTCSATANGQSGIFMSHGLIESCSADQNAEWGIYLYEGGTITHCIAKGNAVGIQAPYSVITECRVESSTSSGIIGFSDAIITNCIAQGNNDGITVYSGSSVRNCVCNDNRGDGLVLDSDCTAIGNTCNANGAQAASAGIHALRSGNRIEGNTARFNVGSGVQATMGGNFIIQNSCGGSTVANYDLAAGNRVGSVITAPATAAVFGNTGAAAGLGTSDPWANISY